MKKFAILLASISILLAFSCSAFAHPPKSISASWNASQETLSVTAEHSVEDAAKHYILSLTVLDGTKQVVMKQYSKQGSTDGFSDDVILKGMKPGTKLRIQLVCNIMGSKELQYTIP